MKVRYAGLQLGLSLRKAPILCPPMREKYNYDTYDPYVRFNCDVGSHAYFDRNKRDNSKIERDFDIHEDLVSICPFYITYKRIHLDDENSAFQLEDYQHFHSHPCHYEVAKPFLFGGKKRKNARTFQD